MGRDELEVAVKLEEVDLEGVVVEFEDLVFEEVVEELEELKEDNVELEELIA